MRYASVSGRVALCGILTAMSVVIIMISGFLGIFTLAAPMIVGGLLIPAVIEYGTGTSLCMYSAVSLLGLMLAPDKEMVLVYILFFGHYPIIQHYLDRMSVKFIRRAVKGMVFNFGILASVLLANIIFGVPIFDEGKVMIPLVVIYILGINLCFVMYDKALRSFFTIYDIRIHAKVERLLKR